MSGRARRSTTFRTSRPGSNPCGRGPPWCAPTTRPRRSTPIRPVSGPRNSARSCSARRQLRSPMRRAEDDLLAQLKARLLEISDLAGTSAILSWDQSTYMPPGGAAARGRQSALMSRLMHERRTDAELGRLIDQLLPYAQSLPPDSDDAALIRVTARDFMKAIRVPPAFVERLR